MEVSWKATDFSAPAQESISLVGKSTGMPSATSGGFRTQDFWGWPNEVGSPTTIFWQEATRGPRLANLRWSRYMKLMRYAPTDWLDVVAMRVECTASSWVNAVL